MSGIVILVERDPSCREVIAQILESEDLVVRAFENIQGALSWLTSTAEPTPTVAFVDFFSEGMLAKLSILTKRIPVWVMSTQSNLAAIPRTEGVLVKPFELEDMKKILGRYCAT